MEEVVIVGGARTPFCEWQGGKRGDGHPGGLLKEVSALKLGEIAIAGALEKTNTTPEDLSEICNISFEQAKMPLDAMTQYHVRSATIPL